MNTPITIGCLLVSLAFVMPHGLIAGAFTFVGAILIIGGWRRD